MVYLAVALLLFARRAGWTSAIMGGGSDPLSFEWFLNWWPFALGHGLNPFVSVYAWFPGGFNLTWSTSVPGAALLGAPLTWLGGPILTYNTLTLLAPALAAWSAFLLNRTLTRDWVAALVGGYLFGFSSYELGHLLGHLNLDTTFVVPLILRICIRRARQEIGRTRCVATLLGLMLLQLSFSSELLATGCVFGAIAWAIFLAWAPAPMRRPLLRLAVDIALAAVLTALASAPFLYFMLKGQGDVPAIINSPTVFSADALNFLIPTHVTRFGRTLFAPLAGQFTGNAAEQGAYLGLPLVILMTRYFTDRSATAYRGALLAVTAALVVLSLGPALHLAGPALPLPLPWLAAVHVPLLRAVLPTRFTMYVALCSAIVVALYLAAPIAQGRRWRRYALAGLSCLALLPNPAAFTWASSVADPFFTPGHVRDVIGAGKNVVIVPFGPAGVGMQWQVDAGMQFTQSGGYVGSPPLPERKWDVLHDLVNGTPGPMFGQQFAAFCAAHRVDYVLVGPGAAVQLAAAITAEGWIQYMDGNVRVVRVPRTDPARH